MKALFRYIHIIIILVPLFGYAQKTSTGTSQVVYQTDVLTITRLTNHTYVHTSFFQSETFGKVPCNGMIVVNHRDAVIFDTPTDDKSTAALIGWMKHKMKFNIRAVVPTHFHEDCVGGLNEFHKHKIPSYASTKTIQLAKERQSNIPTHAFEDSLTLSVGNKKVHVQFFGEGHTRDNVVGYFPGDHVLFGGCLIKELGAGKGNLADANVAAWPETVERIKNKHPETRIVVPGHGKHGDGSLLDYTIRLFEKQ